MRAGRLGRIALDHGNGVRGAIRYVESGFVRRQHQPIRVRTFETRRVGEDARGRENRHGLEDRVGRRVDDGDAVTISVRDEQSRLILVQDHLVGLAPDRNSLRDERCPSVGPDQGTRTQAVECCDA